MAVPDPRVQRHEARLPFFTPVVTPGLHRCWATNISAGGVGLSAFLAADGTLDRGAEIELEFTLGGHKRPIRAVGRIAWTSLVRPDGRVGLGVEFRSMSPGDRAALARFLAEHRPRVIVALASPAERDLAAAALRHAQVDFIDGEGELDNTALRSCASIFVFCHDEARLTGFLDALWSQQPEADAVPGEAPLPPITLFTDLEAEKLLPLLRDGRIYEILRPTTDRRSLSLVAERSCERWALQVERSWASLQREGMALRQQQASATLTPELPGGDPTIIRASDAMRRVYQLIQTVAVHDVPVLLVGETGTGKELAAREVHALSGRASTPFVAQDCGALIETLLESELFGHVRGAFTGATTDHPGLFQIADGGTIFLDEIQNTTPALQAKLLRVVEEGEIRPVGSPRTRRVNVRLIAACNVDLRQAVKEGRFRADFFYRLNRFPVELPPLRERATDVLPLARFFAARVSETLGRPLPRLGPDVEAALLAYDWPGNVRELKNAVERAVLLTPPGEPLAADKLPDEVHAGGAGAGEAEDQALEAQLERFERRLIREALERHGGVIRRAARDLQVNAVTLSRKMRRLGLA